MAWYSQPIKPFDPLNPEDAPMQPERYLRDNFIGTGQDSHTLPPAQDAGQWQSLLNVMPITAAILTQRWGYNLFATAANSNNNWLTNFQRDSDGLRTLIASSETSIEAFNEDGSVYLTSVFTPNAVNENKIRSLTSRSYQYFYDGFTSDLLKWNGDTASGVSNWGIDINSGTLAVNTGATLGSTTALTAGWTNPNNVNTNLGAFATFAVSGTNKSARLQALTYGFTIPSTAIIQGFQVSVTAKAPSLTNPSLGIFLLNNGVVFGFGLGAAQKITGTAATYTFGGPTVLNRSGWTPAAVNAANFGIQLSLTDSSGTGTFQVTDATVTVYYIPNPNNITITSTGSAGSITLTVGRVYYCVFQNSVTGHISDLNSPSQSSGPVTSKQIALGTIPVSMDPQVDTKVILATADGGDPSILYQVAVIPNASTTYTDNTPDSTLIFNQEYLFTDQFGTEFGVSQNDPPPNGNFAIKHQGRLWMAQGQNIFFSKGVEELTLPNGFIAGKYEECWPGDNYFDVSQGAETISGLLSDGTTLYIGTQNHIRRLLGNDPTNFQTPQIIHPQVGLLTQDVWQIVYREGTPAGCMWVTPDFRVIGSDFNTYTDVGKPVQDILNNIQVSAASISHAMFVYDGEFDLYVLSIPVNQTTYCDTTLVYNMRDGHWVVWQTANSGSMSFFNVTASGMPQWLFIGGIDSNNLYQFQQTDLTDAGTLITVSAATSWLHLGAPTAKKVLDEIEILGDTGTQVTILGANNKQDFVAPFTVVSNAPLVLSPFGQWKVFLPTKTSKYRYYQFIFSTTDTNSDFLGSYNIRFNPWNTL